jgi:glyoxylase-like metal-dependent hydrolase (beta-lactamase superfamily II)
MIVTLLLWLFWIALIVYACYKHQIGLIRASLLGLAIYSFTFGVTTQPFSFSHAVFFTIISSISLYVRYRYGALIPESDLFNAGNPFVAVYILRTPIGCVVIDSGFASGVNTFLTMINAYKIDLSEIKFFFVTHTHADHVGALAQLYARAPSAKVIGIDETFTRLKAGAAPVVPGRRGLGWPGRLIRFLRRGRAKPSQFSPVDVPADRRVVFDGKQQILRDIGIPGDILLLPGHTADSIGLLLDDGRLFCGDAAMNGLPGEGRHAIAAENIQEYHRSWDAMITSTAKWIYPAHGPRFPIDDLLRYRHAIDGRDVPIA